MSASDDRPDAGGGPAIDLDDLLARLRRRALDPQRRTSARPSRLTAATRTLGIDGLTAMLQSLSADLDRVVAANRAGGDDPAGHARAEALGEAMTTPVEADLPGPATAAALAAAESALGVGLPPALQRVYTEIADGGFGPAEGLLPLREVVAAHARLRAGDELPHGRRWPDDLIPLVSTDPGFDCLEAHTGRVVGWDPDGLSERSSEARFAKSFTEISPSAAAWLDAWVRSKTQEELLAERMQRSRVEQARAARASIAAKTPAERAAMGLPEVGWERVVWGGIGLDDEDGASGS